MPYIKIGTRMVLKDNRQFRLADGNLRMVDSGSTAEIVQYMSTISKDQAYKLQWVEAPPGMSGTEFVMIGDVMEAVFYEDEPEYHVRYYRVDSDGFGEWKTIPKDFHTAKDAAEFAREHQCEKWVLHSVWKSNGVRSSTLIMIVDLSDVYIPRPPVDAQSA